MVKSTLKDMKLCRINEFFQQILLKATDTSVFHLKSEEKNQLLNIASEIQFKLKTYCCKEQ